MYSIQFVWACIHQITNIFSFYTFYQFPQLWNRSPTKKVELMSKDHPNF